MNTLKTLYREFFGIRESLDAVGYEDNDLNNNGVKNDPSDRYLKNRRTKIKQAISSKEVDEARLINNITDYRGGVEYVLRDPAEAQSVANEIKEWSQKKGFTIIKHTISPSGKVGYFYFRLGEDPARESQRIQGYIAQKPEIKHFRFNVRTKPQKQNNI